MITRAVVVGVDRYTGRELTSAVRDAESFAATLTSLGLAKETEIRLLRDEQATRAAIGAQLKEVYDDSTHIDRLIFFFSGHGLAAPLDPARAVYGTALLPVDFTDPGADFHLLLNLDDLRARLRRAGPQQQYFFVDACRDLVYGDLVGNLPALGWPPSPNPSPGPNAQGTLHAVSMGGTALGRREGLGVLTGDLLESLSGRRSEAIAWSDQHGGYVVTMESLRDHLRCQAEKRLASEPLWKRTYMLPQLTTEDPPLAPLLYVREPPRGSLTLTFEPPDAAHTTTVQLLRQNNRLAEPSWPPRGDGDEVLVEPQWYEIKARSSMGDAQPEPRVIDARGRAHAVVRVSRPDVDEDAGHPTRVRFFEPVWTPARNGSARLVVRVPDPRTHVDVQGLEPPYPHFRSVGVFDEAPPAGFYRIALRLGTAPIGSEEIEFTGDASVTVSHTRRIMPTGEPTSPVHDQSDGSDVPSAIVESARLTLLGLNNAKSFDAPAGAGIPPAANLALVLSFSGEEVAPRAAQSLTCHLRIRGERRDVPMTEPAVPPDLIRLGHAHLEPGEPCNVVIKSPHLGTIIVPTVALPLHRTVVMLIIRPDGEIAVDQIMLPFSAADSVSLHSELLELHTARALFAMGELISIGDAVPTRLRDVLRGDPTDPLTACLAYYAWRDAIGSHPEASLQAYMHAERLAADFPLLPDVGIIAALEELDAMPNPAEGAVLLARSVALQSRWDRRKFAEQPWRAVWAATWQPPTTTDQGEAEE